MAVCCGMGYHARWYLLLSSFAMDAQWNWMKRLAATRRGDIMLHTLCGR
jgi:hypothetical protein